MSRRRITCTLCAATGGLLGAMSLPVAVAFADTFEIVPDPDSTTTVTSLYGEIPASPAVTGIQGIQEFDVVDKNTGEVMGKFDGFEEYSHSSAVLGGTNQDILVTHDVSGTVGTAPGQTPPLDSVINVYSLGGTDSIYSAEPSPTGTDVISHYEILGHGHISTSSTFDAAVGLADHTADQHDLLLPDGDQIVPEVLNASDPTGSTTESFTGITGLTPWDVAVQGTQTFDVVDPAGHVVGTFTGDVTTTSDVLYNYTEAILVTSDGAGSTVGTSAGDVPGVGSVFNAFYSDLLPNQYNLYSAITGGAGGDQVTDVLVKSTGEQQNLNFFGTDFSATQLETELDAHTLSVDGYTFTPLGDEQFTGVNGLPPLDVITQGYQQFDINGTTIDADVASEADMKGQFSEAILITNDGTGTVGTGAGDVPPVGSEFNFVFGHHGMETIYSDIPGEGKHGGDLLEKTLVFSNGHEISFPTHVDPSFGLSGDSFYVPSDFAPTDAASVSAEAASSVAGVDPSAGLDAASAVAGVDPTAGLDAGAVSESLLQSHDIWLEALHALASLF